MLPDERDAAYLWDMREAARDVVEWLRDLNYEQFCENEILHSAVERKLEVFGEAAGRISLTLQELHPEIPWREIKGVRVILAHRYADVDLETIWEAASTELPKVLENLEKLTPQE